jgi:predicted methyltransferase
MSMIKPMLRAIAVAVLMVAPTIAKPMAPIDLANRPADAMAQDAGRKPVEVLAASGIKSGDTVVDVMPGAGYYSELIGRGVGPTGKVIAIEPPQFLNETKAIEAWDALIKRQPNVTLVKSLPGDAVFPAGLNAAFFHLTYHDLYWESEKFKFPRTDPAPIVARLFTAMKKGGTVIVIDHTGASGMDPRVQADKTHRIDPAQVRADFEKAGFKFAGESAVLRTSGDNPATLVFAPEVRGKTDRFYYRFTKP